MASNKKHKASNEGTTLVYRVFTDLTIEHIVAKLESLPYQLTTVVESEDTVRFQLEQFETQETEHNAQEQIHLQGRIHGRLQRWATGEQILVECYSDNPEKPSWQPNWGAGLRSIVFLILIAPCFVPLFIVQIADGLGFCYMSLVIGWIGLLAKMFQFYFPSSPSKTILMRPSHDLENEIVKSIARIIQEGEAELAANKD